MPFAARGLMPVVGLTIHNFLTDAAFPLIPKEGELDETPYVLEQVRRALDLKLLDPITAGREAKRLRGRLASASYADVRNSLLAVVGSQKEIVYRVHDTAKTFMTSSQVIEAMNQPRIWQELSNDEKATELQLMVSGLAQSIVSTLGLSLSDDVERKVRGLKVWVVDAKDPVLEGKKSLHQFGEGQYHDWSGSE